jgi:hypothetical protein
MVVATDRAAACAAVARAYHEIVKRESRVQLIHRRFWLSITLLTRRVLPLCIAHGFVQHGLNRKIEFANDRAYRIGILGFHPRLALHADADQDAARELPEGGSVTQFR